MPNLHQLTLADLAAACNEESYQRRKEEGYCFELFRRAIDDRVDDAWTAVREQYQALVLSWLHRSAPGDLDDDEMQDLVQDTFTRFWRTLSRRHGLVAEQFAHVGGLLKYLQQCALTAVLDLRRRQEKQQRLQTALNRSYAIETPSEAGSSADTRMDQEALLLKVRRWMENNVTDPEEELVIHLTFELGLTPAEITSQYPRDFPNARAVRRAKERFLKRARRSLT